VCHDAADRNGHRVFRDCEFADQAVSGTKLRRDGLDAMLAAAEEGKFDVLYFHSLSRLARESVITMPMLKRLVYTLKVRIISVTEGIDSSRDGWDVIASVMALLHERYIKELSANVFRGQEGAVLAQFSVGDYRFGYTSVPVPGTEAGRKGRNALPRKVYAIDEQTAPWVVRVFHWFVTERRSLRWIARELNRRGAPKDHRATTTRWHHQQVADLLACEKYVGIWPWGEMKNSRDPSTGKIRQESRPPEECEKWNREFPHLRIIDQETFDAAQVLLQRNYERYAAHRQDDGSLTGAPKAANGGSPPHLLSGLIQCGHCGARFYVGGANGKYLFCPTYVQGACECQTRLRRDLAERLILDVVGQRVLADPIWFRAVFDAVLQAVRERDRDIPTELAAVEKALEDVERRINRLVDQVEDGVDDPSIRDRLAERREERRTLSKRRDVLRRANAQPRHEPTEAWLREQLQNLGATLREGNPAAAVALRELVGGAIVVTEIRCEGRKRFHLQGRFTIRSAAVVNLLTGAADSETQTGTGLEPGPSEEIVIDFVKENPLDASADQVKEFCDQGLMNVEIAQRLECSRSQVTKLLHHWFESRGLEMPDGRARRSTLARKQLVAPQYQQLADGAKELWDRGLLMAEIAMALDCDRNTVTSAIGYWHASRGLETPDGRSRRKELDRKVSRPAPPLDTVAPNDPTPMSTV
jgi:DNA invertase Pin-like site-specific DNA recombinase